MSQNLSVHSIDKLQRSKVLKLKLDVYIVIYLARKVKSLEEEKEVVVVK